MYLYPTCMFMYKLFFLISLDFRINSENEKNVTITWCIQLVSRLFLYRHLKLSETLENS